MTKMREMMDLGKAARSTLPRSQQQTFVALDRDPVAILEDQHRTRLTELVPIRIGRMLQSPFTYYRGTAAVMAHDLANQPRTGVEVVSCGDAHISNFGLYASPERRLVFDLNDFDEASVAPWEWDIKRLASSVLIGGRDASLREDQALDATRASVRAYRRTLSYLLTMSALKRYYYRGEALWLQQSLDDETKKIVQSTTKKAMRRTSDQVLDKIVATSSDGQMRIVDQPPIMTHTEREVMDIAADIAADFVRTVRSDIAVLVSQFELIDVVLRVVGVGSVGTRCYIILLIGPSGESLFLQAKEAPPSVLETYGGIPVKPTREKVGVDKGYEGYRVISGQRILQAFSDPFLGYLHHSGRDYYVRQFRDMKSSVELSALNADQFEKYASLCGSVLARGHAQSPKAGVVAGYLGQAERFDQAVTAWSVTYAEQIERDFAALEAAAKSGRVPIERGV